MSVESQDRGAPAEPLKERRKHPRTETYWRGILRTSSRSLDCRIIDVSPEGAQIRLVTPQIGPAAAIGETVMLTVRGVGRVIGAVVWLRKTSMGLHITNPEAVADWTAAISRHAKDAKGRIAGTKLPAEK
ncbi:MAG TPA: PilZ domain-containing protein [Stellaceae bacterium]|nr:PilZ domain-containing protein [Stellaceae bacterium]